MAITEQDLFRSYADRLPAAMSGSVEPYRLVIETRIAELWRWRSWYRARPDWASFANMRRQHEAELHALVRVARQARKMEAAKPDPIDLYQDWTEAERAWGQR